MNDKIVVLTANDKYISLEEWQKEYGLEVGSTQIGRNFSYTERKFALDLKEYGMLVVCAPLMKVMDAYREAANEAVNVNAYNRNEAKQQALIDSGNRGAASTSPHVYKLAVDADTRDAEHTKKNVPILKQAARALGIPIRVGWKSYAAEGKSFIHFDVCPLYYAPGRPRHNEPHPPVWEIENEW